MYSSDFPTLVEFLPLFPFLVDNLLNWAFLSLPKVCQYAALVRITTRKLCGCDLLAFSRSLDCEEDLL